MAQQSSRTLAPPHWRAALRRGRPRRLAARLAALLLCALAGPACQEPGRQPAEVSGRADAGGATLADAGSAPRPPRTFYRDVEPIVQTRCQGCHVTGGLAPFPLVTYENARPFAPLMAARVSARIMPPWPPSHEGLPLRFDRSLTEQQIQAIVDWAEGGAEPGDPAEHRLRHPDLPAIRSDLELAMAAPYTPSRETSDDFRCFVLDPGLLETRHITGYSIVPGNAALVHHAIVFNVLDEDDALEQLEALEASASGPGYRCVGDPGVQSRTGKELVRVIGSWKPGGGAVPLPAGTGLPLPARSRVVLQLHYNLTNGDGPDRSRIQLQLADEPVTEATVLLVENTRFAIPAGDSAHVVEQTLRFDGALAPLTLYNVFPHMHFFGAAVSVSLEQPGGQRTLIDIPRWNFHWQGSYSLVSPLEVLPGDVARLRCVYDNSADHQPSPRLGDPSDPKEVYYGPGAFDEMCLAYLYVTPAGP